MSMYIKMNEEQKARYEKEIDEWWEESTPLQRWQRFESDLRSLKCRYVNGTSPFALTNNDTNYALMLESLFCLSMMSKFNHIDETLILNRKKEINDFINSHEYDDERILIIKKFVKEYIYDSEDIEFNITIEEHLDKTVKVSAKDEEEAMKKVYDDYKEGKITLIPNSDCNVSAVLMQAENLKDNTSTEWVEVK